MSAFEPAAAEDQYETMEWFNRLVYEATIWRNPAEPEDARRKAKRRFAYHLGRGNCECGYLAFQVWIIAVGMADQRLRVREEKDEFIDMVTGFPGVTRVNY
jgi:hypothetical protein